MSLKNYARLFLLLFLPVLFVSWVTVYALWKSGEVWPVSWIVDYQKENDLIWAPLLNEGGRERAYKYNLYKTGNPEVIILGSSRVLQVLPVSFRKNFVNLGRAFDAGDAGAFTDQYTNMSSEHKPDMVIWGLDYWMFKNSLCSHEYEEERRKVGLGGVNDKARLNIAPANMFSLWGDLNARMAYLGDFLDMLIEPGFGYNRHLGLKSALGGLGGYWKDGSYLSVFRHKNPKITFERVNNELANHSNEQSVSHLPASEATICAESVVNFQDSLDLLQKDGAQLGIIIPPLPKVHADILIMNPKFSTYFEKFIEIVEREVKKRNLPYVNGFLIDSESGPVVEYLTAIHPGEVIMARLVRGLASQVENGSDIFDIPAIDAFIDECKGKPTCGEEYSYFD